MLQRLKNKIYKTLRWSEKYVNTDMVYLVKNGGFLFIEQIFRFIISFISAILFAKLLSKEVFGMYNYIISTVGLIGVIHLTGLGTSVVRSVAKGFEGSFKRALHFKLKWGVIISLIILIIAGYYLIKDNHLLGISFLIAAFTFPIYTTYKLYSSYLNGKKKFSKVATTGVIEVLITTTIIITALLLTKSLIFIVSAFYLGNLIIITTISKIIIKKERPQKEEDPETINLGIHLSTFRGLGSITNYLDKFLIYHFLGPVQLAIYYFAITVPNRLNSLLNIIPNIALPKLATQNLTSLKKTIKKRLSLYLLATFFVTAVYILLADYFYQWFFPNYIDSIMYSKLFALILLFAPFSILFTYLQAQALKKQIYSYRIFSSIVQITSLLLFTYLWGIIGVIGANIFAKFINSIYLLIIFKRLKDVF